MKSNVSSVKILNIVLCIIILLIFVLTLGIRTNAKTLVDNPTEVVPLSIQINHEYENLEIAYSTINNVIEPKEVILDFDYYISECIETIKFFSKLFDYNYEDIIKNLNEQKLSNETFEYTNIGYLKDKEGNLKTYPNFEYGLIEYFYTLNKKSNGMRNTKYQPYSGSASYVENLVRYFGSIYQNVNTTDLLSIGAAESGYYKVKFMLKYNNIYGGMSSKGLIKHNNIEQGVLSFVRLMSRNYYGKGLTSIEAIGTKYCPVYENGVKRASSHWINLVSTARNKYSKHVNTITIYDLINVEEI